MRKPVFALCEQQRRSLISTFVVRFLNSIIPQLAKAEISNPEDRFSPDGTQMRSLIVALPGVIFIGFLHATLLMFMPYTHLSHVMRKPVYAICEQQRSRSVFASAQSDQHLCCSLPG